MFFDLLVPSLRSAWLLISIEDDSDSEDKKEEKFFECGFDPKVNRVVFQAEREKLSESIVFWILKWIDKEITEEGEHFIN